MITDLQVRSRHEAIEKLAWYALRWKIKVFPKIPESGGKAEASKLRTAERLVSQSKTRSTYLTKMIRRGGYLAREGSATRQPGQLA